MLLAHTSVFDYIAYTIAVAANACQVVPSDVLQLLPSAFLRVARFLKRAIFCLLI